ncbi:hypothetical protein ACPCAE_04245 [Streptomyces cinereoruber]|uniref:hypothetical protein n=1 Tax=Streptomyces cinereoruber TaxID=67260 RepID=UPI003C2AEBF9
MCVLLPLVGHLLAQGHMPRWVIPAGLVGGAGAGVLVSSRRRLSDTQLLAALVGAQLAYQVAYAVPGVCAVVGVPGGIPSSPGHTTVSGAPPEVFLLGHLIMLVLTARMLGVFDRLLWHTQPVLTAVEALLRFIRPFHMPPGTGPQPALGLSRDGALPPSVLLVRLNAGRAPPCDRRGLFGRATLPDWAVARRWSQYALVA